MRLEPQIILEEIEKLRARTLQGIVEAKKTLWRVHILRNSGGGTPLRIQEGAKVKGFTTETKAKAFWSKKSSKGKEEGHAQGRAHLSLD